MSAEGRRDFGSNDEQKKVREDKCAEIEGRNIKKFKVEYSEGALCGVIVSTTNHDSMGPCSNPWSDSQ